ncbi:MAG: hypothetical protein IPK82_02955 [Polyangiaceae bacterium]|nr:hypothetical protein [Polyangiaceae bacterium]
MRAPLSPKRQTPPQPLGVTPFSHGAGLASTPGLSEPAPLQMKLADAFQGRPDVVQTARAGEMANASPSVTNVSRLDGQINRQTRFGTTSNLAGLVQASQGTPALKGPAVQRKVLPIQGNAPKDEKEFVQRRITEFASLHPQIQGIVSDDDVVLYVTFNRDEDGGDQETTIQHDQKKGKTWILVTLNQSDEDTPEQLAADLLHELVLHGVPAYREHTAAKTGNRKPNFPKNDTEVEQAELAEHSDFQSWLDMAMVAVRAAGPWEFKQRVLTDWLNHADESGLSEDDQLAIHALHQRDWDWLRQNGYLEDTTSTSSKKRKIEKSGKDEK